MNGTELDIRASALDLIEHSHIMTLATASNDGAWSAPVYYLYYQSSFYFFSKPDARHIKDSQSIYTSGASIHCDSSDWNGIRGIQMEGTVYPAGVSGKSAKAFLFYMKQFPFITQIKPGSINDISSLELLFNVRWYKFVPDIVYYLDNTIRFGYRERVDL